MNGRAGARQGIGEGPALPEERPIGRRVFLGTLGAGLVWIGAGAYLGAGWLSGGSFRIYNVAGFVPNQEPLRIRLDGDVARRSVLGTNDLGRFARRSIVRDFRCVTGWAVEDVEWGGIRLADVLDASQPRPSAAWLVVRSADGVYETSIPLGDAYGADVLLADTMNGRPLPARHGGPLRLLAPDHYGYKSVKWVAQLELSETEVIGYWEQRGYRRDGRIDRDDQPDPPGQRHEFPALGLSLIVPPGWNLTPQPAEVPAVALVRAGREESRLTVVSDVAPTGIGLDDRIDLLASIEPALRRPRWTQLPIGAVPAMSLRGQNPETREHLLLVAAVHDGRTFDFTATAPHHRARDLDLLSEVIAATELG